MRSVRDALADATAAALPVAVVYFAGWAYLSKYLSNFDIDATQVSIALTTVLVYAFIPLKSVGVAFYFMVVLTAAGYMMTTILPKTVRRLSFMFVILGLVGLLLIIDDAASRAASNMAAFVWAGEKSMSVPALEANNESDELKHFAACRKDDRLRQIIGLTDEMFVLCRDKYAPCNYGMLFAVSKAGRIIYTAKRRREQAAHATCS